MQNVNFVLLSTAYVRTYVHSTYIQVIGIMAYAYVCTYKCSYTEIPMICLIFSVFIMYTYICRTKTAEGDDVASSEKPLMLKHFECMLHIN